MEGLIKRAYVIGAIAVCAGALIALSPKEHFKGKTEKWMEKEAPATTGNYHFIPSLANPEQSYRMTQATYDALKPYGIVSRVYTNGAKNYDVVLIASANRGSFHDPQICLSGQGWTIVGNPTIVTLHTKTRGDVPATLATMSGQSSPKQYVLFFYRDHQGFFASPARLKWNLFLERLMGKQDVDGVFYRFIPNNPDASPKDLINFATTYLDAAYRSSNGYF